MVALIYPAVHGAGLVWLITEWVKVGSFFAVVTDVKSFIALWLVLFFGVSYVIINAAPIDKYNGVAFMLDLSEIALVFACFAALGYVVPREPIYPLVFGLLAVVPIVQSFWNRAVGRTRLWLLSLVTTGACIAVALTAQQYSWAVYPGTAVLYGLLIYYLCKRRYEAA